MRRDLFAVLLITSALCSPPLLWAQSNLERPVNGGSESGLGDVHGWKCTGINLTYTIDTSAHFPLAYGIARNDTIGQCGDSNNGFVVQQNWNLIGTGTHTIRVFDNGVQFAQATFVVITLGAEFLEGANGQYVLPNFPFSGVDVTIRWQESSQNFVIYGVQPGGGTGGEDCQGAISGPYDSLEGALLVASNGQFLGLITTNCFNSNAICSEFGTYGSKFSSVSILNEFGTYGSEFSSLSPFNQFTSTPPVILKSGTPVAYLTLNTARSPRVDPYALIGWLKINE